MLIGLACMEPWVLFQASSRHWVNWGSVVISFSCPLDTRVAWRKNLSEGLSTLGWPVDNQVINAGRLCPLWAAPFPTKSVLNWVSMEIKLGTGRQARAYECGRFSLFLPVGVM